MKLSEAWRPDLEHYATEPDLAAQHGGALWWAWSTRDETGREGVSLQRLGELDAEGRPEAPSSVVHAPDHGQASWPSLVMSQEAAHDDLLCWVAWRRGADRGAALMCWPLPDVGRPTYNDGPEDCQPARVVRAASGLRRPATTWASGEAWAIYECDTANEHRIELVRLSGEDTPTPVVLASHRRDLRCRPALLTLGDGSMLAIWEAHGQGDVALHGAHLIVRDGEAHASALGAVVAQPGAFLQGPALAASHDGPQRGRSAWLAFSSDQRPDGQAPGLIRWTQLRRVSVCDDRDEEGAATLRVRVEEPRHPAPGLDFDADGEDQSLEFPTLACSARGGLWLLARASHNMRLQRFDAAQTTGWGPLSATEPVLWGCRGVRLSLCAYGDDRLVMAFHGRRGLQLQSWRHDPQPAPPDDALRLVTSSLGAKPGPQRPNPDVRRAAIVWPWDAPLAARRGDAADVRAYWGDIHFHSAHSDGVGTVEEAYLRCRDRYGHDFACLTEHDGFIGRRVTDTVWRMMVDTAEAFNDPAQGFATLIGIEYTGPRYPGPGHKCLYFDVPETPVVCRWDDLAAPDALLGRVEALNGIAIPHHVGWLGGDPEHHTPEVQPCWEICSAHGQYEAPMDDVAPPVIGHRLGLPEHQAALSDHFIRRQLEAGQRFGFVGGSDGHGLRWHHGVSRKADSHTTGLTGVWLPHLGRSEIMAAIRARHTWATSGARMALAFTADGLPQGSVLPGTPTLALQIAAVTTTPWRALTVFASTPEGAHPVAQWQHDGQDLRCEQTITIDPATLNHRHGFVYVRVTQEDGETAWASPCFWG